jgi:signal transduction histidine kinase
VKRNISTPNGTWPDRKPRLVESIDERMIGLMRLILASSALLIIYIDPAEPDRFVPATYTALVLYVVYSLILFLAARQSSPRIKQLLSSAHWIDVLCFTVFIALSNGTNSIFFFFYYFSIIIASFCSGFTSGLAITILSATLFTVVGYLTAPADVAINRLLLRPVSLLVQGYMIAYLGGFEVELRRRLKFLKNITQLSNPRFGIDHTIKWTMEQFRQYYSADECLLILAGDDADRYQLRRVTREGDSGGTTLKDVSAEVAALFLFPSTEEVVIYKKKPRRPVIYNIKTNQGRKGAAIDSSLINTLESKPFLSVPVNYRDTTVGRFYVVGSNRNFKLADADFVLQAIEQLTPQLDNIRLVDHLASNAAERERNRIARDIHDSVVQPYIGLQLGLEALRQKVERGEGDILRRVIEISDLTAQAIADLRSYAGGIKTSDGANNLLVPAVRRFASSYTEATGIDVKIEAPEDLGINDRLAAELFQMIIEGLSNIRRHTQSRAAWTALTQEDDYLHLRIENEDVNDKAWISFSPRSLTERAVSLGGQLRVYRNGGDRTVVDIQIPL